MRGARKGDRKGSIWREKGTPGSRKPREGGKCKIKVQRGKKERRGERTKLN